MKNKFFTFLLLLNFIGLGCQSDDNADMGSEPEFPLADATQLSAELYDIYSLVIDENYQTDRIVIRQSSDTELSSIYDLTDIYNDFDSSLIEQHNMVNEQEIYFGEQFYSDTKEINVITEAEFRYILENEGWSGFDDRYDNSNGIIYFSNAAINETGNQAILHVSKNGIWPTGEGRFIYLTKQNGVWVIVENQITWVS